MDTTKSAQFLYFVKPHDTLSAIVKDYFGPFRSAAELRQKIIEVAQRSGIENPDRIRPGQALVLGSGEQRAPASFNVGCPVPRKELEQIEETYKSLSPDQKATLEASSDILADVLDWGGDVTNVAGAGFSSADKVSEALRSLRPPPPRVSLQFETIIRQVERRLLIVRQQSILALRHTTISVTQRAVVRLTVDAAASASFSGQMARMSKLALAARWGGRACLAVDIGLAAAKVATAPNGQRGRTALGQLLSVGFSGAAGTAAAYGVCNMVLGLPTGGTSVIWCGLVVGGAAALAGGKLAQLAGERIFDTGDDVLRGIGRDVALKPLK